ALLHDLAYPIHRLHVVLERRVTEQPHLRDVRRTQARHAALALDRFDHRRLLAADVGPRAAPEVDRREGAGLVLLQFSQFPLQDGAAAGVFVPQVDPDLAHARAPGRHQHALEKTVRVALKVVAVLEGARLALVDIDRHDARRGLGSDDLPFAASGKSGAAQPPQRGILHDPGDLLARALARQAVLDQ